MHICEMATWTEQPQTFSFSNFYEEVYLLILLLGACLEKYELVRQGTVLIVINAALFCPKLLAKLNNEQEFTSSIIRANVQTYAGLNFRPNE